MSPPTGTALPHLTITVNKPYPGGTGGGEGAVRHMYAGQGDGVTTAFMTGCCGGREC